MLFLNNVFSKYDERQIASQSLNGKHYDLKSTLSGTHLYASRHMHVIIERMMNMKH